MTIARKIGLDADLKAVLRASEMVKKRAAQKAMNWAIYGLPDGLWKITESIV